MGEEDREDALAAILPGEETVLLEGKTKEHDGFIRQTHGTCAIASCLAATTYISLYGVEMESLSPFPPLSPRSFLVEVDELVKGLSGLRFMCGVRQYIEWTRF